MKKEQKFTNNIWITFQYNSMFHVGRTIVFDGVEMVASVSESGQISNVLYDKIIDLKQLKILKDVKFKNYTTDKSNMDFDTNSN